MSFRTARCASPSPIRMKSSEAADGVYAMENDRITTDTRWDSLSHAEKNHLLFLKQKSMLAMFLDRGAITQAQHDKSLHDLKVKMGETD